MDTTQPREISVIEPIGAAFEKTKEILFQPFDITKWFVIGFCAWLATLGNGGGLNGPGGGGRSGRGGTPLNFQQTINNIKDGFVENLHIIIPVAIAVFVFILVIGILVTWLKSRGQFMFLHCVARNVAEVKKPWKRYATQGNSLFLFKVVLWLIGMMVSLIFTVPIFFLLLPMIRSDFAILAIAQIMPIIILGIGLIIFGISIGIVNILTKDFVVPIMYISGRGVMDGWLIFWRLCSANFGKFTLFLLFLLVVGMGIGMLVFFAMLITCCCAACILAIPYVGTVAMLPILVWRRAYSALFLAQFGPEFDVFAQPETVDVPTDAFPVLPETPETPLEEPPY